MNKIFVLIFSLFATAAVAQTPTPLQHFTPGAGPSPGLISTTSLNKMVDQVNNLSGNGTPTNITGTRFYAGNGTVALPAFTFTSDPDGGMYRIGANNIGLSVNGAKVLDIGTTGLGITGVGTITSASATALTVGRLGATTPALLVNASTATSITGISVTSAASGSGVAIAAIGETNVNTTIDAAGNGTLTLNSVGTGNIIMGRAVTGLSTSVTGTLTARSATATPAAASAVAALSFGSAGITITWGTGTPSASAAQGSIYIQTDGSSSSTRLYINTNGTTGWAAITTAS